ncbi:coiled-coil domain-containing protein 115-like [Sminthopsis crassicaudata]|uniref:coiled-coil domain-containing protein 115-like n=1 Tax=Sminthopsis crassicaudata TaxID=9301 RepID=UPI003D6884DA
MATAADSRAEFLRALSTELDVCIVQIFQELEQLEEKRATLNALVEEGWFSLSKSRFTMGTNAVSPLQYASSMTPLFRVCTSEPESGWPQFQVTYTKPQAGKDSSPQEPHVVIDCEEALLPPVPHGQPQQEGSPLLPSPPPFPEPTPQQDPLNWFGILVPQSLRHAQGIFQKALLMVGEIAELQSQIKWRRARIQILRQEKQKLLHQLKLA